MTMTADPHVAIESRWFGYIRYRNTLTGRRWEVHGKCAGHGTCQLGAAPDDLGWLPSSERLDIPVTPELVCDPCTTVPLLRFVELEPSPQ